MGNSPVTKESGVWASLLYCKRSDKSDNTVKFQATGVLIGFVVIS